MLGGKLIRTGASVALLSIALFGCAVPVPFIPNEPSIPPGEQASPLHETASIASPEQPTAPVVSDDEDKAGADLWRHISASFVLQAQPAYVIKDPLGELADGKRFLADSSARAAPFLHYIVHELERRQLPLEIALIPLLESGYNAAAGSPGGPAGLWQLMPETADRFGLQRTAWYDGRRDVVASTDAALNYLEHLRDRFGGDWWLAFAAYNCGERAIEDAVERNRQHGRKADFWALAVPANTKNYIRRLLATTTVIADPGAYGVTLAQVPGHAYFDVVDVGPDLPLTHIKAVSGFDTAEFDALNPAYRRQTTVAGATRVLVKHRHSADVVLALSSISDDVRRLPPLPRQHMVKAGETLAIVAARHGTSLAALQKLNQSDGARLRVGQTLNIPAPGAERSEPKIEQMRAAGHASSTLQHVVAAGDNLWDLARHYGLAPQTLVFANGLTPNTTLHLGQKLRVPAASPASEISGGGVTVASNDHGEAADAHYEVQQGDSLWTISRRFNVSVDALRKWNRLAQRPALQPGQRLVVSDDPT